MERRDNVRERCAALEQRTAHLQEHSRPVERQRRWPMTWPVAAVAALGLALALPLSVQAKTFRCSAGDVACLIDAINAANANGEANTLRLAAGTYTLTAADNGPPGAANGLPVITSPLTITGRGADTTIIERDASAEAFRILEVAPAGTLTLKRLTLRRGNVSFGRDGGGILNEGTLTLVRTTVIDNGNPNTLDSGGGIFNSGTLTLLHSAVISNRAFSDAGIATNGGTVTIAHSTIERNLGFSGPSGLGPPPSRAISPKRVPGIVNGALLGISGGGIGGTVIITESAITHNAVDLGAAGITNAGNGTMVITNTTIAANFGTGIGRDGGGIRNSSGTLLLTNSTLADNLAVRGSGGISQTGGTVLLLNTLLAQNSLDDPTSGGGPTAGPDCAGVITSLANNLIGDPTGCTITLQPSDLTGDPGLGAFTDNGRPGNGHFPLLPTSQAIDAGNDALCPRTDQLGRRRLGPCDMGAIAFRDRDDRQHEEDDEHEDDDRHDNEHDDTDPVAAAQAGQ